MAGVRIEVKSDDAALQASFKRLTATLDDLRPVIRPDRFSGGGMRLLRFKGWLTEVKNTAAGIDAVYLEEVRRHAGTSAAQIYGGFLAHVTAWCEHHSIPYQGVPVGTIKRHVTGKGNASKDAVIEAVRARGFAPADDNEADAIALLLWAIESRAGAR